MENPGCNDPFQEYRNRAQERLFAVTPPSMIAIDEPANRFRRWLPVPRRDSEFVLDSCSVKLVACRAEVPLVGQSPDLATPLPRAQVDCKIVGFYEKVVRQVAQGHACW